MKKLPINNFKQFSISKQEESSKKGGGIFCEVYIGYIEQNKNASYNSSVMQQGMIFDGILATEGMQSALAHGGQAFWNMYS